MILYYDGQEGDLVFPAWTTAYKAQEGTMVGTLTVVPYPDGCPVIKARGWTVSYHPTGDPACGHGELAYGPFESWAEATQRLQSAYARYAATGDPEAGLEYLESSEYPWPGLA